ncbi:MULTISPECIES: DUF2255 family protein [Catenuloplanes]|uniref:DUF2255 family protein n=1 Tax=Catenuloplanes niger TaxID=587534 RepID=A0AAE4CPJ9_9ACTN|nr:DUF2255 family protein [Catenuloplanes niger]MDR7320020.1 hypothetical protein [Catenuloplanes niger]
MTAQWSADDLRRIDAAVELEIAVRRRSDDDPRRWVPIWVVCAGGQVFVRTWYRRDTGWYGQVLRSRRARVRVPGLEADVTVDDVGGGPGADVDAAYVAKYGRGADSMVTGTAAATTLRIDPA